MKYRLSTLLVLGLLAISVWSQSPGAAQTTEKQLVYAMPYDFTEFSIFTQSSYATAQWMGAIFAGAYERDSESDRAYAPLLAESMPTIQEVSDEADGTVMIVTVKLKSGLKFSNGDPLTAEDLVYTVQLHMTPMIGSGAYGSLTGFFLKSNDSVKAVDDTTVEFRFKIKYAFYIGFTAFAILPKEIYQPAVDSGKYDFEDTPEKYLIGAGPFMLESIDTTNNVVTVVKNPNWKTTGLPEPGVDKIVYKKIGTKEAAIAELKKGTVDLFDSQYKPQKDDFAGIEGVIDEFVTVFGSQEMAINHIHPVWGHTAQLDDFLGVTFNYNATGQSYTIRSFWNDISGGSMSEADRIEAARLVREAMSYIVPREDIVDNILEGFGEPAPTTMPKPAIGWDPNLEPRKYSVLKAGELIKDAFALAGWTNITTSPGGDGIYFGDLMDYFDDWSIALLSPNTNPARNQWAALMEVEFPRIGIDVRLHTNTGWDVIAPRTFNFDLSAADYNRDDGLHTPVPLWDQQGFDLLFVGYAWGLDWDPQGLWETWAWLPFGFNFYNYWDPDYDAMTDSYVQELDFTTRLEKAKEVQKYLYDYQPAIPLVYSQDHWAYRDIWEGFDFVLLSSAAQQWWRIREAGAGGGGEGGGFVSFSPFIALIAALGAVAVIPIVRRKK